VRATGHDRGLARAQAFSRPSSASHLGARPPATRRAFGEAHSQVTQREGAHPKVTHAQGVRPKMTRTEGPRPKLAHAASPRPKVNHAESPRPEGRAERQAPEQHQAQRQESARPEARSERHQEPSHVETRAVSHGSEHNASPQVTHRPAASHPEAAPTQERRK
jgi:hypothetical protein